MEHLFELVLILYKCQFQSKPFLNFNIEIFYILPRTVVLKTMYEMTHVHQEGLGEDYFIFLIDLLWRKLAELSTHQSKLLRAIT